jgi:RimJ/RimL family protein N-acetyltransferase
VLSVGLPSECRIERVVLRRWMSADRRLFADMNSDPEVMEHFPAVLSREESDRQADRIEEHFITHGFGLWALEIPGIASFAGFVGLSVPRFEAPFTPCVEIGWRLVRSCWGCGYVTEAAQAVLKFGFDELRLDEIVSFTVPSNTRSRRVMERLGMVRDPCEDFEHPLVPVGHPLRHHVLYRKAKAALPNQGVAADGPLPPSGRSEGRR